MEVQPRGLRHLINAPFILVRPPPLALQAQQSDSHFLAALLELPPPLTLQVQRRGSR
jgi:hypothetical protein